MDLSIIIVNWNSAHFLRACLDSIYKHVGGIGFEIIVVDNASYDGSADIIRKQFHGVVFIQSDRNLGFSKANNLGYRQSSGKTLLFLNPDTELLDDCVQKMYAHLHSGTGIGAVGCRVLNSDLTIQRKYVQCFPTISSQLLGADLLVRMFPKSGLLGIRPLDDFHGEPLDVEVLSGSCLMVKREVFERVGCFNEEFFMYAEDVDLCYVIKQAGYAIRYVWEGTLVHHSEKSSVTADQSHFSSVMQRESIALFFKRRKGTSYAWLYKGTTAAVALLRIALLSCITPFVRPSDGGMRLSLARAKWTKLLRWSFGLERWAAMAGNSVAK